MNPRPLTFALFVTFLCVVPVIYFVIAGAGILPLVVILRSGLGQPLGIFNLVHVLVYGPLLYLAARLLSRSLSSLQPPRRTLGIAVVLAAAFIVSLLPIYGVGHNSYEPVNLYQLLGVVGPARHGI